MSDGLNRYERIAKAAFPLLLQAVYNASILLKQEKSGTWWRQKDGSLTGGMLSCARLVKKIASLGFVPKRKIDVLSGGTLVFHHVFDEEIERAFSSVPEIADSSLVSKDELDERDEEILKLKEEVLRLKNEVKSICKQKNDLKNSSATLSRYGNEITAVREFKQEIRNIRATIEIAICGFQDKYPEPAQKIRQAIVPLYRIDQVKGK